jgi:catechol 2,3-dioxygenase-like lactoylglutathione lyase family enzyme
MTPDLRPAKPAMLNHAAFITHDTSATAAFYTEILGMDFVAAVMDDRIPSTGDPVPYFHSFFKMQDGSTIAFFEAPELPRKSKVPHPAYKIFEHMALEVETTEAVDQWYEWLTANEIEVVGPVDHQIIYSIYFYDPNGIRLELTTPIDPTWNDQGEKAVAALAEWEAVKARAAEDGAGIVEALAALTKERSHQASRQES